MRFDMRAVGHVHKSTLARCGVRVLVVLPRYTHAVHVRCPRSVSKRRSSFHASFHPDSHADTDTDASFNLSVLWKGRKEAAGPGSGRGAPGRSIVFRPMIRLRSYVHVLYARAGGCHARCTTNRTTLVCLCARAGAARCDLRPRAEDGLFGRCRVSGGSTLRSCARKALAPRRHVCPVAYTIARLKRYLRPTRRRRIKYYTGNRMARKLRGKDHRVFK